MEELDIARTALMKNHVFETITSTDGTVAGITSTGSASTIIKNFYDQARRKALRQVPWTCVMKRVVLSTLGSAPLNGFSYSFVLPDDYVNQVEVVSEYGLPIECRIEGRELFADESPTLVYIPDVKDPNKWDPLLAETVALQLASDIAYPLTGSHENEVALAQAGMMIVQQALAQTRAERHQGPLPSSPWRDDLFTEVRR